MRQSVVPKDGDVFRGEAGTVLDGQGTTAYAFNGHNGSRWVNRVTIQNLTVTRYAPPSQMGAIRGIDFDRTQSTSGWTLDSVEVSYSKSIGVKAGNRMRILRSNLHHNESINIGGSGVGIEGRDVGTRRVPRRPDALLRVGANVVVARGR